MVRALGLAFLVAACGGEATTPPAGTAPDAPVAKPPSVMAVLAIRGIDPAFVAARRLMGPLLPAGADGRAVAVALAGLEPAARDALDPDGTAFVLAIDHEPAGLMLALPLERTGAPVALAAGTEGAGSRVGQYFVTARDRATIEEAAPWITRALAGRSWEHDLVLEVDEPSAPRVARALVGMVTDLSLELGAEARAARAAMGRDPEIGEPEAIAGWVEEIGRRWAAAVGDAAIRAHLDSTDDAVAVRIELEAAAGSTLAGDLARTAPGDLDLLRLVPADAPLAVGLRRSDSERRDASFRTLALLGRIAGPRMAPEEAATLRSLLAAWDAVTGTEGAFAVTLEGSRATLRLATEASGPDAAAGAIDGLADSMGRGYLGLVGDRLGAWAGPASRAAATRSRVFRGGGSALLGERWEISATPSTGQLRVVAGPSGEIDWGPPASVFGLADVASLCRAGGRKLVALGAASPTRLLPLVARLGGDHLARFAGSVSARAVSDPVTWSVAVDGRRLLIDLRIPPPEIRAFVEAAR